MCQNSYLLIASATTATLAIIFVLLFASGYWWFRSTEAQTELLRYKKAEEESQDKTARNERTAVEEERLEQIRKPIEQRLQNFVIQHPILMPLHPDYSVPGQQSTVNEVWNRWNWNIKSGNFNIGTVHSAELALGPLLQCAIAHDPYSADSDYHQFIVDLKAWHCPKTSTESKSTSEL